MNRLGLWSLLVGPLLALHGLALQLIDGLIDRLTRCRKSSGQFPDVVVLSAASWYYVEGLPLKVLEEHLQQLAGAVEAADAAASKVRGSKERASRGRQGGWMACVCARMAHHLDCVHTTAQPPLLLPSQPAKPFVFSNVRPCPALHPPTARPPARPPTHSLSAQQAGKRVLWLLMTVPDRVRGRSWSATWHAPLGVVPQYNRVLRGAAVLHPQGPALLLDVQALSQSERRAEGVGGGAWARG